MRPIAASSWALAVAGSSLETTDSPAEDTMRGSLREGHDPAAARVGAEIEQRTGAASAETARPAPSRRSHLGLRMLHRIVAALAA